MKIRTGFVTNSSSYSSTELKIKNYLLLEILKRYAAIGLEYDYITWDETDTIAYKNEEVGERLWHNGLAGVLEIIINVLDDTDRSELKRKLINEIKANQNELLINMADVVFTWEDWSYGDSAVKLGDVSKIELTYSKGVPDTNFSTMLQFEDYDDYTEYDLDPDIDD